MPVLDDVTSCIRVPRGLVGAGSVSSDLAVRRLVLLSPPLRALYLGGERFALGGRSGWHVEVGLGLEDDRRVSGDHAQLRNAPRVGVARDPDDVLERLGVLAIVLLELQLHGDWDADDVSPALELSDVDDLCAVELRRAAVLDVADEGRDELWARQRPRQRRLEVGALDVEAARDPGRDDGTEPLAVACIQRVDVRPDDTFLVERLISRISAEVAGRGRRPFVATAAAGDEECETDAGGGGEEPHRVEYRPGVRRPRASPGRALPWLDSAADVPPRSRHRPGLRRAAARLRPVARRAPEPAEPDRARPLRRAAELRPADHGARVVGHDLVAEPGRARLLRLPEPQGPQLRRDGVRGLALGSRAARLGPPLGEGAPGDRARRAADLSGLAGERGHGLLLPHPRHEPAVHVPGCAQAGDRGARRRVHGRRAELPDRGQGARARATSRR